MAGMGYRLGQAGVGIFAAVGVSQTVWFGVKAMQNHDPGAETRTRAASTPHALRRPSARRAHGHAAAPLPAAPTHARAAQPGFLLIGRVPL